MLNHACLCPARDYIILKLILLLWSTTFLSTFHSAHAALSDSDISGVLGDGFSSGTDDTKAYKLTVAVGDTDALFAMEASGDVGWVAIGVGSSMTNADMYIAWPDSGSKWVLSRRTSKNYEEPKEVSGGSSDLKLITDLSSSSTVVFTVDAKEAEIDSSGKVTFIWASCATKPDSTDTDAEIEMHDSGKYGSTSISLASSGGGNGNGNGGKDDDDDSGNSSGSPSTSSSTPTGSRSQDSDQSGGTKTTDSSNVSSSSSSSAGSDETTGGSSSSDNSSDDTQAVTSGGPDVDPKVVFIIHAIFAIIAWVVFTPLAIVFGRFRPYKSAATQPIKPILYWMHMHERLQYSTLALTCIVVALGVYGINAKGVPHFSETHQLFGVVFLGLLVGQVALGWTVHALGGGGDEKRPLKRCLHIVVGLTLTSLGLWQCWTGWQLLPRAMLEWPSGGRIACAVAAGLLIALYIIKVMHTMIQRNSLINTYNARARSIRMPESTESVLSRTRTDKLQKDIEELTERAQGFSKQAPGLNPSKSMTRSASSKSPYYNPGSQVSYNAGSMAPASSVPFGVAHQPYYGDSYGPPPGAWPGGRYY